jgi:hypothetical protein
MSEAAARILCILLRCGMIAREEQEIVRDLIRAAARAGLRATEAGLRPRPGTLAAQTAPQPQLR